MNTRMDSVLINFNVDSARIFHCGIRFGSFVITSASTTLAVLMKDKPTDLSHLYEKVKCYVTIPSINNDISTVAGKIVHAWKDETLLGRLSAFAGMLTVVDNEGEAVTDPYFFNLLGYVFLVKLDEPTSMFREVGVALHKLNSIFNNWNIRQGTLVKIYHTPFGNRELLNCLAEGVVAKVLSRGKVFIMESKIVPGCQGSPIYITDLDGQLHLFGMVVCTLVSGRGEVTGFSFAVTLRSLVDSGLKALNLAVAPPPKMVDTLTAFGFDPDELMASVVVVNHGHAWGSGFVVQSSLILTAAHIITSSNSELSITTSAGKQLPAKVVFMPPPLSKLDVAVLAFDDCLPSLSMSSNLPAKGEVVVAVGFPLSESYGPSMHLGLVSGDSTKDSFTTTCLVHSGMSGGPVVQPDGEVVGMVLAHLCEDNKTYPYYNKCYPTATLNNALAHYARTKSIDKFLELAAVPSNKSEEQL